MPRSALLLGSLLLALTQSPAAAQTPPAIPAPRAAPEQPGIPSLGQFLHEISAPSAVRFQVAPAVANDPVHVPAGGTAWPEVIRQLLRGYNYVGTRDAFGRLKAVTIAGRNGDGTAPPDGEAPSPAGLFAYQPLPKSLPSRFHSHAAGSVYRIRVAVQALRAMEQGARIAVDLPDGRYSLVHDHAWPHENGDLTWVGKVEDQPAGLYRAILTLGENGVVIGRILTPGGLYELDTANQANWLIDIKASGLQRGSYEGDQQVFPGRTAQSAPLAAAYAGASGIANAALGQNERSTIDALVLVNAALRSPTLSARLNNLADHANQAYLDSGAAVQLRLVAARKTTYPNATDNTRALQDLTWSRRTFTGVPNLRRKTGADVVVLIRPLKPRAQGSCGAAWVNGSEGSLLAADQAYAVISYGQADGYYCSSYTLAHEIGHVLGASHDREHANIAGRFRYSYGYGIEGRFGDIMSYYDPEIGLFANPDLVACDGLPCGIPDNQPLAADVVRTFNQTAPVVSAFQ